MAPDRPDPDALLARVQEEDEAARRGRLRIYFGASAGVGKTYAMLQAAHKLQAEGQDVLAGVVVTHGRSETQALLEGLPGLPLKPVSYRGKSLDEFDLDACLHRHPGLVLVDELAHTNVPGSRHPKRWQDVEELLASGIDVYTTLNVQHLESLNDVVGGITGVRVQETVPDTFFDKADEVVMVDTPADELLTRLKAGKVYMGTQAERAARHFFRKGNLMALREIALRRTADRVEDDVQSWRLSERVPHVWQTEEALLCALGPGLQAERVVRSTARLAQQLNVSWHAVHVETPSLQQLPELQRERTLRVMRLAQDLGARTALLTDAEPARALAEYARKHNLSKLVIGHSATPTAWQRLLRRPSMAEKLLGHSPELDLVVAGAPVPARAEAADHATTEALGRQPWGAYAGSLLVCGLATLVCWPLQFHFEQANIVMLYLMVVLGVSLHWGRGPAVLASFLSVGLFDFFFVEPKLSFAVSDVQYLVTFAVMLVVGLVTGHLTAGLRFQARVAAEREARSRALFELTSSLAGALQTDQVMAIAETHLAQEVQGEAAVFMLDLYDTLQPSARQLLWLEQERPDLGTARWTLQHNQAAGLNTDTLPGSPWFFLPLSAPMRTRGVLALKPGSSRSVMQPEERAQLETCARTIGQALERVHYIEVAQKALVDIESERLRNSLLSTLSHDLRTPLAGVYGLAQTLTQTPGLPTTAQEMSQVLCEQAQRVCAMVNKLLDMARLQSGPVQLNRQWQPVDEVVGSALTSMANTLQAHHVQVDLPADLPLLHLDAVLMERVLCNLLENASKYTPPGSLIHIEAHTGPEDLTLTIEDNGLGLPAGQEETLFTKFTRGEAESSTPGMGLGLAICRTILDAHGGQIWAQRSPLGGAAFVIRLPLGRPPQLPDHDEPT